MSEEMCRSLREICTLKTDMTKTKSTVPANKSHDFYYQLAALMVFDIRPVKVVATYAVISS